MWLVLEIWAIILAVILLYKNKLPQKRYIIISFILSVLVALSYLNVSTFSLISGFAVTLISSLAVFSTFATFEYNKLILLNTSNKKSSLISVLLGIGVGVLLGIVNYGLMIGSNEADFNITLSCFTVALSPAIYEEIVFRSLFYAFCINLINGQVKTKFQRFTCWFMMIIPHVLIHTPDNFIYGGIIGGIVAIAMYVFIFALPFAILQKKRDITSAMIAHGVVDIIRFLFFGLPF